MIFYRMIFAVSLFWLAATAGAVTCEKVNYQGQSYAACTVDPSKEDLRLFLNDDAGKPYGSFTAANKALAAKGQRLSFAMNGGMYHKDRSPVGLYIEGSEERKSLSTKPGPGNFHMLPNGVFWLAEYPEGVSAFIAPTQDYIINAERVSYATQSGPMLVIDGALHPRFRKGSDSLRIRNGVGQKIDGTLVFVMSDAPVNFYSFASLFKDHYSTPNALYLDGTISRLYAPELGRNDFGAAMGPIVGVVEKRLAESAHSAHKDPIRGASPARD